MGEHVSADRFGRFKHREAVTTLRTGVPDPLACAFQNEFSESHAPIRSITTLGTVRLLVTLPRRQTTQHATATFGLVAAVHTLADVLHPLILVHPPIITL